MRLIFGEVDLWEFDLGEVDGCSFEIIFYTHDFYFFKIKKKIKSKKSDQI